MSKKYYRRLPDGGYQCLGCMNSFSTREEMTRHTGFRGRCKNPLSLGMTIDIEVSPYRWHRAA